jgi:hypothetical protein
VAAGSCCWRELQVLRLRVGQRGAASPLIGAGRAGAREGGEPVRHRLAREVRAKAAPRAGLVARAQRRARKARVANHCAWPTTSHALAHSFWLPAAMANHRLPPHRAW